jgi:hypothetical protein
MVFQSQSNVDLRISFRLYTNDIQVVKLFTTWHNTSTEKQKFYDYDKKRTHLQK